MNQKANLVKHNYVRLLKFAGLPANNKDTVKYLNTKMKDYLSSYNYKGPLDYRKIRKFIKSNNDKNRIITPRNYDDFTVEFSGPEDPKFKSLWKDVMVPFLKNIDNDKEKWVIEAKLDNDKSFYNVLTKDSIDTLKQAFDASGLINFDVEPDDIDSDYHSDLIFGKHLVHLKRITFSRLENKKTNGNRKDTVHYFPFYHTIAGLDLSMCQIYDKPTHVKEHCLVNALKYYGIDVSAEIPNTYIESSKIIEICEDACVRVCYPDSGHIHITNNKDGKVKLLSAYNHIMPDIDIPISSYFLKHMDEIPEDLENRCLAYRTDKDKETGEKIYRTDKKSSMKLHLLLKYMFEHNLFKPISLYDSLFSEEPNLMIYKCRDIQIKEPKAKQIIYERNIPVNPERDQIYYKGKVISESNYDKKHYNFCKNPIIHYNISAIANDIPYEEFLKIIDKVGFNKSTIPAYAHSLFLPIYKELGVKEICGPIHKYLDLFRKGGILKCEPGIYHNTITIDINSLFAFAMSQIDIPVGDAMIGECDDENIFRLGEVYWRTIKTDKVKNKIEELYNKRLHSGTYEKMFYKKVLCNLYGKCMPKMLNTIQRIVNTEEEMNNLLLRDYLRIKKTYQLKNGKYGIDYYKNKLDYSLIHVGLAVVFRAREIMEYWLAYFEKKKIPVYLVRIDSITFPAERYDEVKDLIGDKLGEFKKEFEAKDCYIKSVGNFLMYNSDDNYKGRLKLRNDVHFVTYEVPK